MPLRMRLATYNVHRCLGADGDVSPHRIARVLEALAPDVIALQELDVARARTGRFDQPRLIAEQLNMDLLFHPAICHGEEGYGNALLSRLPLRPVRRECLPASAHAEPRAAIWATVPYPGGEVQVITTHLGLGPADRLRQANAILDWLADPACRSPRVLCGDLNAWPGTRVYRAFRERLGDAQATADAGWPRNTFPARLPLVRLDHVFHSPDIAVLSVRVPRTALTRVASDHLPVFAELLLP